MLVCLLLGGVAEGLGLASLLPVVSIALGGADAEPSPPVAAVLGWLGRLGIPPDIFVLMTVAVGAIVVKNALNLVAMTYVGYTTAHIATSLRRELVENLLRVRWSHFTEQPTGRVTNALSVDATRAGQAYLAAATSLVYAIQALIYAGVALFIAWQVALLAIAVGALIAAALGYLVRRAKRAGRRQTRHTAQFVTYLADALTNIKPLKAMNRQDDLARLLDRSIAGLRQALRRQVLAKQALRNASEALAAVAIGFGFAAVVAFGQVPPAELAVLVILLIQLVNSINKIQREYQKAVIFESAYYNVLTLIAETAAEREIERGTGAPALARGCRLEAVSFAHPRQPVLRGVTVEFPANRISVLTGPSGSGKTTIIDLLLGFHTADTGRVLVDGRPLEELSLRRWRSIVGYVPQDVVLLHDTILANVALGAPDVGEAQVREALRTAGALGFVEALPEGLHAEVGEKGAKLSGGQRQRIALARALVGKPRLLILDEVTSALDAAAERAIVGNIRALRGELTVIAITHRPAFLEIADRVYELVDGRVVAGGTPPRLAGRSA